MKKALLFFALGSCAFAQTTVFRVDPTPAMTTAGNAPPYANPALYAVANATIALCSDAACTTPVASYRDISGVTQCPVGVPVTLPGQPVCQTTAGAQGQFGFWLAPGTYYYKIYPQTGNPSVCYPVTVSSTGTVTFPTGVVIGVASSSAIGATGTQNQYFGAVPNHNPPLYAFQDKPETFNTELNFTPQSPGGTINPGSNTITMVPVPLGVNGSDIHHYLYLSGGTGTAEPVLITGGSGTSGQASGTIQITASFSHTGAWTVSSATAGAEEAFNIRSTVNVPPGQYDIYGPIWFPFGGHLNCATGAHPSGTAGATTFIMHTNNLPALDIERDQFSVSGCVIQSAGTGITNGDGIKIAGGGSNISGATADSGHIWNVTVTDVLGPALGFNIGIRALGAGGSVEIDHVQINGAVLDGIQSNGEQGYMGQIISEANGGNAFSIGLCAAAPACGWATFAEGLQSYNDGGSGLIASDKINIGGQPSFLNNDAAGELHIIGTQFDAGFINNVWMQFAGQSVSFTGLNNATAPSILLDSGVGPLTMTNLKIFSANGNCVETHNSSNIFSENTIATCGVTATTGFTFAISQSTGTHSRWENNTIQGATIFAGTGNQFVNNFLSVGNSSTAALHITSTGSLAAFNDNFIFNGTGNAVLGDSGCVLQDGLNSISGTNASSCVTGGTRITSLPLGQFSMSTLPAVPTPGLIWVTNANPGTAPCTVGGGGALAVWGNTQWDCLPFTSGGAGGFYQTVQINGTPTIQEPVLNLVAGSNVNLSATDTSGVSTNVTVTSTGGGGGSEPGQTGSDFGLSVIQHTLLNDTLQVNAGNWIFGGNQFTGTNACQFTLNAGTGTGVGDVWLSRSGFITLQYTSTGGNVVVLSGTTTNCVATAAATPQFPNDGSKYIGQVPINGAKTWDPANISQYAFAAANYFTQCSLPMICTVAGDSVTVSGASTMMQTNTSNSATAASAYDFTLTTGFKVPFITSSTNCSSVASPAVCGSAMAGSVAVLVATTSIVVNTTAVTANSQIDVTFDASLGTKLGVTCNTAFDQPWVSARTAATSFTVTVSAVPTGGTNPACYSYKIFN